MAHDDGSLFRIYVRDEDGGADGRELGLESGLKPRYEAGVVGFPLEIGNIGEPREGRKLLFWSLGAWCFDGSFVLCNCSSNAAYLDGSFLVPLVPSDLMYGA